MKSSNFEELTWMKINQMANSVNQYMKIDNNHS